MEFHTYGKPDNPALLLIPAGDMDPAALYGPLKALEKHYYLLLPAFSPAESPERRVEGLEECLQDHFTGRIWGAYGLDEGGSLLLSLLSRDTVQIRTAIADGSLTLPPEPLPGDGRVMYWYGSRNKAAKKLLKTFRERCPRLQTLQLKKLRAGERFLDIRPDQMAKRLRKAFGTAKLVNLTVLLNINTGMLWEHLMQRDHQTAERLKTQAVVTARADTLTLQIEGRSTLSKHWSHRLRLEALEENLTLCTHQLELSGGAFPAVRAKALLKKEHKNWKLLLAPAPHRRLFRFF